MNVLVAIATFLGTTLLGAAVSLVAVNLFFGQLSTAQVLGIFYPAVIAGASLAGVINHLVLKRRASVKAIARANALQHFLAAFLAWGFILLGRATGSAGAGRLLSPWIDLAPLVMAALAWSAVTVWAKRS